ncbi:unnamed protein product, partial [Callosobruchus maculatus]
MYHLRKERHEIAGNAILSSCIYCNKMFTRKQALDDHILRERPNSLASGSKIKEGTKCTDSLNNHMKDSETVCDFLPKPCEHYNAKLKSKQTLDAYILREHPYSVASSSKAKEGKKCTDSLNNDMLKDSETVCDSLLKPCEHYSAEIESKETLDAYILRE